MYTYTYIYIYIHMYTYIYIYIYKVMLQGVKFLVITTMTCHVAACVWTSELNTTTTVCICIYIYIYTYNCNYVYIYIYTAVYVPDPRYVLVCFECARGSFLIRRQRGHPGVVLPLVVSKFGKALGRIECN